jgi:hypothetical protein
MERIELPLEPHLLGVPSGLSKMISKPMVCSAQMVLLSSCDTNTGSKSTETRFHMTHVTQEFHRVRLKWFLSLWYVQHKMCTYLSSKLALSPNKPKCASTSASSPRSTIRCVQMNFEPMVRSVQTLLLSCTNTNTVSKQTKMRFYMIHIT